jgi:hypothetical protein
LLFTGFCTFWKVEGKVNECNGDVATVDVYGMIAWGSTLVHRPNL